MDEVITKKCAKCGLVKPLDDFNNSKKGMFGKRTQCRDCDKKYKEECKAREKWITIWKPCTTCGVIKFASEFYTDNREPDGLKSRCIECEREAGKKSYYKNIDKIKAYRDSRSDIHKKYMNKYYIDNKEEMRVKQQEYNHNNRDVINEQHRQWRLANPQYMINYRIEKREELREWSKDYAKRNPNIIRENNAKRRLFGFDPININNEGFEGHHLWLTDNQDFVVYMPGFLHRLYKHDHNKIKTMITPNALALDFMINEELYRILYFQDTIFETSVIDALDSGVISFIELSNMMYESRKLSNNTVPSEQNTQEVY